MIIKHGNKIKTYSELITIPTYEERFDYLNLNGVVGEDTFGSARYLNQMFYTGPLWRKIKRGIILRDKGCDLGIEGHEIYDRIYIHHMNSLEASDIINQSEYLTNPEYLICTSFSTHNAIHYGTISKTNKVLTERTINDTCPWKH